MTRATFFKHFELLADQPDAVAKMRELVLQLAVQGKLVDQDPEDEPASKLLEQIKKQSRTVYHAVSDENAPYQAPTNWIWVKLGFLAEIERGGSPRPIKDYITDDPDGLNWIKIGDTEKGGKFITSTQEKIRKEGLKKTRKVYPGDFLLTNSMSFGRPYITKIEGCIHDGWLRIHPPRQITSDYLYCLLSSPFVYAFFSKAAAGAVVQNLNADKVRELPIPLPPLAEQRRIVVKVDELMALCDELEQRQQARQHAGGLLQQSALHHLLAAREPQTFAAAWQRVRDHFHLLHDTPDAIPQLRQAILQLAVQGRLVPQSKARNGSENVRFESIIQSSRYGTAKKCDYRTTGTAVLRIPNVVGGKIDLSDLKRTELTPKERNDYRLEDGDILMVRSNGGLSLVGRAAVVSGESVGHAFAGYLVRVRIEPDVAYPAYVVLALSCFDVRNQIEVPIRTTSGVKNINTQEIYRLSFPLPPLAEQKRIVARVEELLRWCDTLEAQLHQTRTLGAHLLASTLHHLLAA